MSYEVPATEQSCLDFIRYAEAEIKRSALRAKQLEEVMRLCREKIEKINEAKEKDKNALSQRHDDR